MLYFAHGKCKFVCRKQPQIMEKFQNKISEIFKDKIDAVLVPIIAIFAFFSLLLFSSYKPQEAETPQVKGVTDTKVLLPVLQNAELLSENSSSNTRTITLQTKAEPNKVMNFYKTTLNKRDWELDAEGENDKTLSARYKRDGDYIDIAATIQDVEQIEEKFTIVTLEIANN